MLSCFVVEYFLKNGRLKRKSLKKAVSVRREADALLVDGVYVGFHFFTRKFLPHSAIAALVEKCGNLASQGRRGCCLCLPKHNA